MLKGLPNGIMQQTPISCQFERKNRLHLNFGKNEGYRRSLEDWSSTADTVRAFYLIPPAEAGDHGLMGTAPSKIVTRNTIYSGAGAR